MAKIPITAELRDDAAASAPEEAERPSKTRRKKEMHELQDLGERLAALSNDQLARIELPEALREAIAFDRAVTSHEGRRRHRQYLGKLMRTVDGDQIRAALGRVTGESRASVALMHHAERWRDRLLVDDSALTEFLSSYPATDVQWLRAAIRAARHEHSLQAAPRHARELYRWLHAHLDPAAGPADV